MVGGLTRIDQIMEEELHYVTPTFKSYGAPACGEFYIHGIVTTL